MFVQRFPASASLPSPFPSPAAVFTLLTIAVVCASRRVLSDGDTFTHIAAGEWMLAHGAVLTSDPFSSTFAGRPWVAHEWLSEVLLALAYRGAGLSGVVLLTAVAAGAAFGLLARDVGRWCGWRGTTLLVAGALLCAMPAMLARPHMLALPLLVVWVAGLLRARERGRAPGWWLLAVMVVWANLHGGFAFGLALAVALAVEATCVQPAAQGGRWWRFVAASFGAALLTPQGWDGLLFPGRLLQLDSLALIQEWQAVRFSSALGFEWVLLGLLAMLGMGRVRVPWFTTLLLVVLLHLALAHARHVLLFGVTGALLLAEPVGRAFVEARRAPVGSRISGLCWSGVAVVALLRLGWPIMASASEAAPVSALAEVPAAVARAPVLNSSLFGGYLALTGVRPFIDGRAELFGDRFIGEYVAMAREDEAALSGRLDSYGIEWAILTADDPLVGRLDRMPGWRRQYADAVAVVFVRG